MALCVGFIAIFFLITFPPAAFAQAQAEPTPTEPDTPAEDPELPKFKDLPVPTAQQLLQQPPVDWIVLKNERVIVCQPISPRPDTLAKMQARIEESRKWPRPVTKDDLDEYRKKRDALNYLTLLLPGGDEQPEYQLHMRFIAQILHHEDLMLKRVDLFLDAGELRDAFEMLFVLERNQPSWPGSVDRHKRLLLLEGLAAVQRNDPEAGLTFLEELHARDPKFEGLKAALGAAVDRLVAAAVSAGDFLRARHFLKRLRRREPQHAIYLQWRDDLLGRANALLSEARIASQERRHDVASASAQRAALVWPATPGLPETHRQFVSRFQSLRVGVVRLPGGPTPYPFASEADLRLQRLSAAALFEVDSFDETARYRSPLLDGWEPTDLGRRVLLSLRPTRSPSETVPVVTARELAETLAARLDPQSTAFDERLAAVVAAIRVPSPFELELRLARAPFKLEALFRMTVERSDFETGGPSSAGSVVPASPSVASTRFGIFERDADRIACRRLMPEPDGLRQYHVAEVVEQKYPTHDKAVQGLLKGEISMLAGAQAWDVERLRGDGRFFVQATAIPATHLVQFNPRTKALRNRELRRALGYAVARDYLLREVVLKSASPDLARAVSGPFPTKSTAYNGVVAPTEYEPAVATILALAAKKQMEGKLPELTLIVTPDPLAEEAAAKLVEQWQAVGIPVRIIDNAPADGDRIAWDLAYRIVRLAEPAVEIWPLLTLEPTPRIESLQHLPHWLARELIELDESSDGPTATALLRRLHAHLSAEMELIPLWEADEFVVIRKNIRGFRTRSVHPYQSIESWIVDPWYSAETP